MDACFVVRALQPVAYADTGTSLGWTAVNRGEMFFNSQFGGTTQVGDDRTGSYESPPFRLGPGEVEWQVRAGQKMLETSRIQSSLRHSVLGGSELSFGDVLDPSQLRTAFEGRRSTRQIDASSSL